MVWLSLSEYVSFDEVLSAMTMLGVPTSARSGGPGQFVECPGRGAEKLMFLK